MSHANRFSRYSLICTCGAALATLLATRSFENGDAYTLTNAPYLMAPIRFLAALNPFRSSPPDRPVYTRTPVLEFSEIETMHLLVCLALAATVLALGFGLTARARREASHRWAGPLIASLLVGFQASRLLYWISQR